jgi:hypothetical protein
MNPHCYRAQFKYDEAVKTLKAAERDLNSTSVNASPFAVRRARVKTAKRELVEAKDFLLEHRRTCLLCRSEQVLP